MLRGYAQRYCLKFHFYPHLELYFVCGIKATEHFLPLLLLAVL